MKKARHLTRHDNKKEYHSHAPANNPKLWNHPKKASNHQQITRKSSLLTQNCFEDLLTNQEEQRTSKTMVKINKFETLIWLHANQSADNIKNQKNKDEDGW